MPYDKARLAELRSLLAEVLELAPDASVVWLEAPRIHDPIMTAEVEALLAAEIVAEREGFLESSVNPGAVRRAPESRGTAPWRRWAGPRMPAPAWERRYGR